MARPRAADYDVHRAQILTSAAALFAQRGYSAATMADLAAASGVSKPTLYHYFRDKHALLHDIAVSHVRRLEALVDDPFGALGSTGDQAALAPGKGPADGRVGDPQSRLRALIARFMQAYADARSEHRVLTEDVKFLAPAAREEVIAAQRRVVDAFAQALAACRPDLPDGLHKPLAMLLFGMINWTFTWLQPGRMLDHESLGPIVADLFFGGLGAVKPPRPASVPQECAARAAASLESAQAGVGATT